MLLTLPPGWLLIICWIERWQTWFVTFAGQCHVVQRKGNPWPQGISLPSGPAEGESMALRGQLAMPRVHQSCGHLHSHLRLRIRFTTQVLKTASDNIRFLHSTILCHLTWQQLYRNHIPDIPFCIPQFITFSMQSITIFLYCSFSSLRSSTIRLAISAAPTLLAISTVVSTSCKKKKEKHRAAWRPLPPLRLHNDDPLPV